MDEVRRFDEPHRQPVSGFGGRSTAMFKRISWGAVFAGVVVALVVMFLLNLLGLGIGLATVKPLEQENPLSGLGTGAVIWWGISLLISMFAGGWVAGRLAGIPRAADSILHGVLAYSVFTMLSLYLLTSAVGSVISGVGSVLGQTLSLAGKGVAAVAPEAGRMVKGELAQNGIDLDNLKDEARQLLRDTGKPALQPENLRRQGGAAANDVKQGAGNAAENPGQAGESADQIIDKLFARGDQIASAADRDAAVNVIMKRTGKSREEANQIVDNWINTYQQSKQKLAEARDTVEQKAREAGDTAASAVSKASIFAFFGLVLAGGAAGLGAKVGEPHDVVRSTAVNEVTTPEDPVV